MPVKLLTSGGGGVNLVPSSSIASDQTIYLPTSGTSGGTVLCTDSSGGTANGVLYLNGSKQVTSGSGLVFDASGNLLVGKTSATANGGDVQVSKGITFPATQVACSDANTLDDYEEGTWTPSVGGNTTYSVQQGQYVKVGRLVYIQGKIIITTLGTGSSTNITNLPFVATYAAGSINGNGGVTYFSSLAVNALALTCFNSANTTVMGFNACTTSGTGISGYNAAVFGANTRIDFSICYEADA